MDIERDLQIELNTVPEWLLNMSLSQMRCKHVLAIYSKEQSVLNASTSVGYDGCLWGK